MKEVIQLNLTEKELVILQALTAVAIAVHLGVDVTFFEKNFCRMESYMDEWPEASASLADKMSNSLEVTLEILRTE